MLCIHSNINQPVFPSHFLLIFSHTHTLTHFDCKLWEPWAPVLAMGSADCRIHYQMLKECFIPENKNKKKAQKLK